jgi:putative FmdB family regulatory protein
MPNYEYKCGNCGYKFEKYQKMSDKPIEKCPKCGGTIRRLFSKDVGIIFKGPGFYSTDYRRNKSEDRTCCGRTEPCEKPPCSNDGG